ncbi:MAG: hypothetical protein QNL01_03760 [Akkermansiaceae bacterium]|jgi:hypothetical protein|tara:strand:+ start:2149 stop:2667 length:519 start_codon:yes stop_codon:yes gene_type:complete
MEVIKKTKVFCVNFHFSSKDCSGSVSGFSYFAGIMGFASGLTLIPMLVLLVAFIFGSVLARRGEKTWRTMLMLVGSITQVAGIVAYIVGVVVMISSYSGFGGSSSSSGIANSMTVMMVIMGISGLLILAGMVCFAIGFVTYCARAGAAGKRADELEEMLGHLQQRVAEQDQI